MGGRKVLDGGEKTNDLKAGGTMSQGKGVERYFTVKQSLCR